MLRLGLTRMGHRSKVKPCLSDVVALKRPVRRSDSWALATCSGQVQIAMARFALVC